MTGSARAKASGSPPTMTESWPLTAPAWPPETGASMKLRPMVSARVAISRASLAEVVVWSMKTQAGAVAFRASVTT